MQTLDDIRARYPHLGVSLYAMKPRGPVTLELISSDGAIYSYRGPTEAAAVARFAAEMGDDEPAAPEPAAPAFDLFS